MDISTPRSNLVVRFLSLFLLCCNSLYASSDQTGKQKVTVVGNDVTLETVFRQIEKQTGLRFMYSVEAVDVKEKVTVVFEKVALDEVLGSLLGKKGIEWGYRDGVISLRIMHDHFVQANVISPFTLTGRIIDANGNPVPGATILLNKSKKGTKTDVDGKFSLVDVQIGDELLISSIGFETKLIKVEDRFLIIKMKEVVASLDETIIRGYGTTTQRFNTGSIVSVKGRDIEKQPVLDPLLALQGRVPGMIVTQTTGMEGGKVNVQIRGRNSIRSGTQPLFIVDGVPYQPNLTSVGIDYGAVGSVVSALSFLNSSDIESIEVLKDADATAIYGSRGANGVILISTKKGKIGDSKISVSVNSGWKKIARRVELLDTKEYLNMRREALNNDNVLPTTQNAPDLLMWDTTRYTDWQKALVGNTGRYTDAQASVSGGNPSIQYLIGGNYHKETTIFPGKFNSQRGGAHFSIGGTSSNQKFVIGLTGSYNISKTNFPGGDFATNITLPPDAPQLYNLDGNLNWEKSTWVNPLASLVRNVVEANTNNIVTNIDVAYKVFKNTIFKVNVGYNELRNNTFKGATIEGTDPAFIATTTASGYYMNSKINSWITEPQLTYSNTFGNSSIDVLAGATILASKTEGQFVLTSGILEDALIKFPSAATTYSALGEGTKYKYAAVFGRIGYNIKEKYLFNFSLRRDGSSRFGPSKKFANFWSIGTGWIFSQEEVLHNVVPFLSFGKIRASYGITGNDQIGDYQYLDQYSFVEQSYQGAKGVRGQGVFNPYYAWEKTRKTEIGLEMGFLKNRFLLITNYYSTYSTNQLLFSPLPSTTGSLAVLTNLPASIKNSGWEFSFNSNNINMRDFRWSSTINLSLPKNKLVSYNERDLGTAYREGKPLSEKYLFKILSVDPETGSYFFADKEGKPIGSGQAYLGGASINTSPTLYGGMNNSFSYKGFQLDIFFQFTKQNGFNGLFATGRVPGTRRNQSVEVLKRWRAKGDVAEIAKFSQNGLLNLDYSSWLESDKSYGDASFIRCKNIAFSWQLPIKWCKRMHISNGRLYLNGQNLFTITGYRGWDPETQSISVIPPIRVATVGIQLSI
ncbi:SusC/RagA family TonB-linked outer membrane protein [Chitinophaga sp. CF418]|uniref:SusC/RagA family TonB-linked outer membrane protein n=1 Tax=Chitinophaga sp. CF418 TaxID=1855287 RepID=UPI000917D32D|nr:SusC/RagA family TonB-linked outer membrane protein [Chitinophaga sp. CF418]SHN45676.1 TonB-linked outer membrane protein, SusC/RagA family [Chitinophaga sp. CF418]